MTVIVGGLIYGQSIMDYAYLNESCGDKIKSKAINIVQLLFPLGGIIYTEVIVAS